MPKKIKIRTAAVIEIGSNELKLLIGQTGKNGMTYLENLSYPLWLGRDTFQTGKMSFDKADKACGIIKNFLSVAETYAVKNIKTIATTAVREAANMDYILDQIKVKTGVSAEVIDDMDEKLYIYKLLTHFTSEKLLRSAMMVYIGAGNIGVSFVSNEKIPFTQNIRVGSLRMGELFGEIDEYTREFYRLMEEYLSTFTDRLAEDIPVGIENFIVSGHEIEMIAELAGANTDNSVVEIPKEQFLALYEDIKLKTPSKIAVDYGINDDKAEVLLPAACIYKNLFEFTRADVITASRILPCDAVLYEMLYPKVFSSIDSKFNKNTLLSAQKLARRYQADDMHSARVYRFVMNIFVKMKKIHGLGSRAKLLLQTAAILHDVGKFINIRSHYQHSYEIVSGSDIVGLNHMETEIVALICLFHSRITPPADYPPYEKLDVTHRVLVSKLTAILRLADALARSHTQKVDRIAVKITENALLVTITTDKDIALEQWSFNEKGRFFEEVFGIKAVIHIKQPV